MKVVSTSSHSRRVLEPANEPGDLSALTGGAAPAHTGRSPANGTSAARAVFMWLRQIARDPDLSPLGYRVAIEISQCVDRRKGYAHPSHGQLATDLDASRRGIQLALKQLRDRGHLDVKVSRGAGHANRYSLRLDKPDQEAA